MLEDIISSDIPWSEKVNKAIYRGAARGVDGSLESCAKSERCSLCYKTFNSTLVDAKITNSDLQVNGASLFGDKASYEEQLKHKGLIMIEGKDVST